MKLKRYIKLRGFTMSKICDECCMNLATLSMHCNEHRKLPQRHAIKIARLLDISEQEVLNNDVKKKLQWIDE